MSLIMLSSLFCIILVCVLMTVCYLISMKINMERDKASPFECGFSPNKGARLPFSLRFFLIAVIFLIFDVEITLLLPIPLILMSTPLPIMTFTLSMFIIILLLGLYYEWAKSMLEWAT
uniref:NADH-ubiquinone oxidoreductase chain 3 n=1 Tax=Mecistocephalus marmoratus TaxID=980230 RepID=A0A4Y1K7M3_9MYRI|nr:NADH dehydrogenase subunit 3 [Mecistocephalus marmoratus]ARU77313.1 NADH dehydrogenase subunit 3 [Mecistocephalus marmoratus]